MMQRDGSRVPLLLVIVLYALVQGMEPVHGDLLSESTFRTLATVREAMDRGRNREAVHRLRTLAVETAGQAYEQAVVYQTMGYAYHALGQKGSAARAFEFALKQQALPENVSARLRYDLARLLITTGDYRDGVRHLRIWLETEEAPVPEAHYLLAVAAYQLGDCGQALEHVRDAIDGAPAVPEPWYQLMLFCLQADGQFDQAAGILEILIERYPGQGSHWVRLADVYQLAGRDRDALVVLELAYRQDLLGAEDILRLARLYRYLDLPYPAARLLGDELGEGGRLPESVVNWRLLADSLYLAHEIDASIDALARAAALSTDGRDDFRVGQMCYERSDWDDAAAAFERALQKGGLNQPGRTCLLLGVSAYRAGDLARAGSAFTRAAGFEATRGQAEAWLDRLQPTPSERE